MENITIYVATTAVGAAFPGAACSAWATLSRVGDNSARPQTAVPAAGQPDARFALRPVPASTLLLVPMTAEPMAVMCGGEHLVHTSKQTNHVHKTRINAGGYGAMGPHPEREPA